MTGNTNPSSLFAKYVSGIVDPKIRTISLSITGATGYLKSLVTSAQGYSNTASAAANTTTTLYSNFSNTYLGVLGSDPATTPNGNVPKVGTYYIRSTDGVYRYVTSINSDGQAIWTSAVDVLSTGAGQTMNGPVTIVGMGNNAGVILDNQNSTQTLEVLQGADGSFQVINTATGMVLFQVQNGVAKVGGSIIWNTSNDGLNSGLDAGMLGGQLPPYYATQASLTALNEALSTDVTSINTTITTDVNALNAAIMGETNRAENAEGAIANNLNSEVGRASAAESNISNSLASEINRATGAENTISSNLTNEINRAKGAESALNAAIPTTSNIQAIIEGMFSTSLASNWVIYIPSGTLGRPFIIQCASYMGGFSGQHTATLSWPVAFPNICFPPVVCANGNNSGGGGIAASRVGYSTTTCTATMDTIANTGTYGNVGFTAIAGGY